MYFFKDIIREVRGDTLREWYTDDAAPWVQVQGCAAEYGDCARRLAMEPYRVEVGQVWLDMETLPRAVLQYRVARVLPTGAAQIVRILGQGRESLDMLTVGKGQLSRMLLVREADGGPPWQALELMGGSLWAPPARGECVCEVGGPSAAGVGGSRARIRSKHWLDEPGRFVDPMWLTERYGPSVGVEVPFTVEEPRKAQQEHKHANA